ncbi:hypothetical protein ACUR5C_14870 [Aliikangiella sp. IMCC44653]
MKHVQSFFSIILSCLLVSLIGCSTASIDRSQKQPLLLVDSEINAVKKVALVNVFSNRYPMNWETKKSRDAGASLGQIAGMLGGDTSTSSAPEENTLVAERINEYTFTKIQREFQQQFGWQFSSTEEVANAVTNIPADMALSEETVLKNELTKARTSMLPADAKMEAIRQAEKNYRQATKSVKIKNPVSYPGPVPLLVINREQKEAARIQLASIAREMNVDAVMAICVYLLEKDSDSLIGLSGKKPAVAINMIMVDSNGKALVLANKFKPGKSRIWLSRENSSQLGFLNSSAENKAESFNLYQGAIDAALEEHKIELANLLAVKQS